jgi:hypothetical protein
VGVASVKVGEGRFSTGEWIRLIGTEEEIDERRRC